MTVWSGGYTVEAHARQAARDAGVEDSKVEAYSKASLRFYRFPLPDDVGEIRSVSIARGQKGAAKKSASKSHSPKPSSSVEPFKFGRVIALMRRPAGASMTEIIASANWQRHTARGRISDGLSKSIAEDERIWSRRESGETYYVILKQPSGTGAPH